MTLSVFLVCIHFHAVLDSSLLGMEELQGVPRNPPREFLKFRFRIFL